MQNDNHPEPVAWRTRWKSGSERDREWEMWTYRTEQPAPNDQQIIEPLYAASLAEGQPSYDVKLEARPAKGGNWTEIYPAQLNWVVKEGHEVRATETVRSSPAANAEQRRAEVCAAVAHVLHGRNRQCDYPIYETQDDRGLDEAEYIDFAMDVLASLRSRSQPVTASQREIAINLLGWPSPEKAAEALLSKFNVTCKTTEEPRG